MLGMLLENKTTPPNYTVRNSRMSNKPPKHPNRVKTQKSQEDIRLNEFRHLKKGHLYKLTHHPESSFARTSEFALHKTTELGGVIAVLEANQMVMYLETKSGPYSIWHKIVYGDQVGWILGARWRFRSLSKRMLRRMDRGTDGAVQGKEEE